MLTAGYEQKQRHRKLINYGLFTHGFLAGIGLLTIIAVIWFSLKGGPSFSGPEEVEEKQTSSQAPPSVVDTPGPQASPKDVSLIPKVPEALAVLQAQLEEVLWQIREANLTKNISQFLDSYSSSFPQRREKRQEVLKIWRTYDYRSIKFKVEEIKPLETDSLFALVSWDVEIRDRRNKDFKELSKTYQVWFIKEAGKWRIQALKNA